ncbi:MAG: AmmeMemoRadiSam system protein B [Gemmataceae bacterium]|nr:AmmeMemoRadiSam system protein B [Gemmataceae bacterium]MCS7270974.1 AmmeMemoRadiSam system protein B [Gemmataceae bacterium]MDW8243211.1 AmmeMemoRadiSam system protein B [Thermogemmata sp.]
MTTGNGSVERPKLRLGLAAQPHKLGEYVLFDPLQIGKPVVLSGLALAVVDRFDGQHTPYEIAFQLNVEYPQVRVTGETIATLARALDEALLLDSPHFWNQVRAPIRKPVCIGTYEAKPEPLREQLTELFVADGGAGLPRPGVSNSPHRLRAVLVPHMDYRRGNITYGHGFKELIEQTPARVFVIIGTSHYSPARFSLTEQHFETPLGIVETDRDYVHRIAEAYGDGVFADPLAHVPEHSIELEVVLLQFLLGDKRPFKIVPLLVGSMQDCIDADVDPTAKDEIVRMVSVLRQLEEQYKEPVCYIISGDLAHIGPKFDDARRAEEPWLTESRAKDWNVLEALRQADAHKFFRTIAQEGNARRICGLSPTWLTLQVARPSHGKALHYQQYVHPEGYESVSFAAAAFYG